MGYMQDFVHERYTWSSYCSIILKGIRCYFICFHPKYWEGLLKSTKIKQYLIWEGAKSCFCRCYVVCSLVLSVIRMFVFFWMDHGLVFFLILDMAFWTFLCICYNFTNLVFGTYNFLFNTSDAFILLRESTLTGCFLIKSLAMQW